MSADATSTTVVANPWRTFTIRTGKGPVVIRSIIEFLASDDTGKKPLRDVQQNAFDIFERFSDSVSLQYVKNLIKELETHGLVIKSNRGRHWFLNMQEAGWAFAEHLESSPWGTDTGENYSEDVRQDRDAATEKFISGVNHMNQEIRLEPVEWRRFWELYKSGALSLLSFDPVTHQAKEHPNHPGVWIVRPIKKSGE
jgi:hypothetical protein